MYVKTMRILHLSYDDIDNPWLGGGGAIHSGLLNQKLSQRHNVTVLTGSFPDSQRIILRDRVRYIRIGTGSSYILSRLSYAFSAPFWIQHSKADLIVADFSVYAPVLIPLYTRTPAIAIIHNILGTHPLHKYGPFGLGPFIAELMALRLYRSFITVSHAGSSVVRSKNSGACVKVIPFAPSEVLFKLSGREQNYILFMGRIDVYQKGLDLLLNAFVGVHRKHPEIVLKIVGKGTTKDETWLERLIVEHGLEGAVQRETFVTGERKFSLLSGAMFLCMPSRYEGWPMVAMEAAASAKTLIGTNAPGLSEIVQDGQTGFLVPPEDWRALGETMCALIENPELRRQVGEFAREWAGQFREEEIVRQRELFYQEVVENAKI